MSVFVSRSLVFSTLLHASVAGLLLVLMLRMQRDPEPVPFIIDWSPMATPAPVAQDTSTTTAAVSPVVNFTPVKVSAPVRAPVVEQEVDEPAMTRPVARTATVAAPTPARTTIAEHRRRNPAPAVSNTASAPTLSPTTTRINMGDVLAGADPVSARPATADLAQSAAYWDRLLGKLRAVHEKPAGLDDGLVVRVEFLLRADGTVGDVRILASSGSAEFDASVVAAFRRLGGLGSPPAGKAGLNQVTFRTQTE